MSLLVVVLVIMISLMLPDRVAILYDDVDALKVRSADPDINRLMRRWSLCCRVSGAGADFDDAAAVADAAAAAAAADKDDDDDMGTGADTADEDKVDEDNDGTASGRGGAEVDLRATT